MTATTEPQPRIATLDIVRGVAVMGILAMNVIAFAMPLEAYMNPAAYGLDSTADFLHSAFIFNSGSLLSRELVCKYGLTSLVAVSLTQKHKSLPSNKNDYT